MPWSSLHAWTLPLLVTLVVSCRGSQHDSGKPGPEPALSVASGAASASTRPAAPAPPAAQRPVVTEYHGVKVTDDYAWLQKADDPDVQAWSKAENGYARAFLDALPDRAAIFTRVKELLHSQSSAYLDVVSRGGLVFAIKRQPPKQQPFLVVRQSEADNASERVLVDPNEIDSSGKTAIDFFVPSRNGELVAVSLSKGGSESGTVHVFDVATGQPKGEEIPRVNGGTAGGSLTWMGDRSGFFYTRYPAEGERPPADLAFYQQVYAHKLGKPVAADAYSLGKDFPRIAETKLDTSHDGRYTLASVANGDGGEFSFYLRGPKGEWSKVAGFQDKIVAAEFGRDDSLYLVSHAAPRGQVLRLSPPNAALEKAEVVVPESEAVIEQIAVTPSRLFVVDLVGGPSQIRVFPLLGPTAEPAKVPILPVSSVTDIAPLTGDAVLFRNESYLEPAAWYRYDAKSGQTKKTVLAETSAADMSTAEVVRETCTSKDGTKVPLNVVRRKGKPYDRSSFALLTGYGGYSLSRKPRFRAMTVLWLEQGGVFADANLRGGGEFGEAWHRAGNLQNKQNVFDDFYACAKHLVDEGATVPERLSIAGGSNGGLLMGAQLVQHPEMYRAVISYVGIYDMLHVEDTPNGAFNVTEFGSVKDPDQFRALHAYSPFHNAKDGTRYPSVLFLTGANDPRVDPYNSRKMTARLQKATTSGHPVLLRANADTGHGIGTPLDEEVEQTTDAFAFLWHELGMPFHRGAAATEREKR